MPPITAIPLTAPVAQILRDSHIVADLDHGGYLLTLPDVPDRKRQLEVKKALGLGGGVLRQKLGGYAFSTDPRLIFVRAFAPDAVGDEPVVEVPEPIEPIDEPAVVAPEPVETPVMPTKSADASARATLVIHRREYPHPLACAEEPVMFEVRCRKAADDPGRVILSYQTPEKAEQGRAWLMNGHDLCKHCKTRFRGHVKGEMSNGRIPASTGYSG